MRSFDRTFSRELAERGWLGITWPAPYGSGRSHLARLVVTEELLRAGAPVAAHWISERQIGPALLRYGTDEIKQEFLPEIASGELTICLVMSESEAGSDLASVRTTAVRDGAGFRVTGTKIWTTIAHVSAFAYVLACTDRDAPKAGRLTELLVDMRLPEVEVRPILDLHGEHQVNEVSFDGAFASERHVIGEVGRGWEQVTAQLAFERGGPERFMSTYPLLERLLAVADPDDTATCERLGDLMARLHGLRALARRVAREMDTGRPPVQSAAILKVVGTRFEHDVVAAARWMLSDAPPDSELRRVADDAELALPGISLRGGATEILAGVIAVTEVRRER
jgi:alkylation response protein AidB-like acyl-CoA dehydrogenase